jgi:hypothetical protein
VRLAAYLNTLHTPLPIRLLRERQAISRSQVVFLMQHSACLCGHTRCSGDHWCLDEAKRFESYPVGTVLCSILDTDFREHPFHALR